MNSQKKSPEYIKNERTTNKVVSFFMLVFVAINIINEFVLRVDYFEGLDFVNRLIYFPISIVLVSIVIVAWVYKFEAWWLKYLLMGGVVLMSIVAFFVFTTYMLYFIFVPIFISTRYFNKKMIYIVSIVTAVLFVAACILNVALEPVSDTIKNLHINTAYNTWQHYLDAIVYVTIPCLLVMTFLTVFGINLTTSGRNLLIEQIENNKKISSVEAELDMAAKIQKSVLPKTHYQTKNKNFSIFAHETPAKEVCGDFFDYFMAGKDSLAVIVADVSDKGVPAAMFMMSAKKVMQCAIESCTNLSDAVELANKLICNDNEYGMFLTLWMGVIDIKSGVGKYVNAGHPYPIIKHADGSVEYIKNKPNLFLGNFPDKNPTVNTFVMKPDDALFIYTDGLVDALNDKGESFGISRVENYIRQVENNPEKICNSVINAAKTFANGYVQFDDITALCLKCNKIDEPITINRKVMNDVNGTKIINDELQKVLNGVKCPDDKRRNMGVVVDEICTNIIEYGYECEGEIEFNAVIGNNYVELEFTDEAEQFNPLEVPTPIIGDEPQIGGLGIYFIKQLSDGIEYKYQDNKNKLKVFFVWNV